MGIETTKALQARRREAADRIERLIARAHERSPISSARRARIKESARQGRRRIMALSAAQQAVTAIEVEIGQALLRIVDQGMSRNQAFELAGLSRHLGRRYLDRAQNAQRQVPTNSSTNSVAGDGLRAADSQLELSGAPPAVTTPGRNP